MSQGTYEIVDGRPSVKFERELAHPPGKVWAAVTEPEQLGQWFPTSVQVDLRVGGAMSFGFPDGGMEDMTGEVTELEPGRVFAFLWGDELLRFEIEPEGDGCRLRLTHFITNEDEAARNAAGWHVCLDRLDELVSAGSAEAPGTEPTDEWREHYDRYVEAGMPAGAAVPGG